MRLALIPPIDLLHYTERTTVQLMLPQLMYDPTYSLVYRQHCAKEGMLVILDNGAAEGYEADFAELHHLSSVFAVSEVVLPDTIKDAKETQQKAEQYFSMLKTAGGPSRVYMYVVQGTTYDEFYASAEWAIEQKRSIGRQLTIGIPRHMIETLGDPFARFRLAMQLSEWNIPHKIHLLGASPLVPDELRRHVWPSNVRSTDTSSPFNYAFAYSLLSDGETIRRPENYFHLRAEAFPSPHVMTNVNLIMGWATGR